MKTGRDDNGELVEVYKRIYFKVLVGQKTFNFDFVAKPHGGYTPAQIEHEKERVIDYIDEKFPKLEFREVQLLPNRFNFICIGTREKVASLAEIRGES